MNIVILFHNIGGYHAARLRAAQAICAQNGWQLTAIQETDNAYEHPWGDLSEEITFSLETLLSAKDGFSVADRRPESAVAANRLPACLARIKPDLLVIPGWGYPISRAALKWAKKYCLPAILMSESKWNDAPRSWWKETLKSLFYTRQFKSALVGGQLHRDYLTQLGLSADQIFFGYDVVDNDYFTRQSQRARHSPKEARQRQAKIPNRPYFIAVTRFIPRKNIIRLINAFSSYKKVSDPDNVWDLVICGSGLEEPAIRAKIARNQLENSVHLPGFKSYQEIPDWFGLASAFIHPALSEQWGLVVNEALASGLPALVSNRCGCFPELIHEGDNGFGFDPEDPDRLTALMTMLSDGTVDIEAMRSSAFEYIQDFSPKLFGDGFEKAVKYAMSH